MRADLSSKGTNLKIEAKISTKRSSERSQRLFLHPLSPQQSYFLSIVGLVFWIPRSLSPISTFHYALKLNKRPEHFPLGPVNLGHQRLLILDTDPTLSTTALTTKLNFIFKSCICFAKLEGKMKLYLILSLIYCFYQSTLMAIKLELKKNILNFSYEINANMKVC